jgi:hypothetical protein
MCYPVNAYQCFHKLVHVCSFGSSPVTGQVNICHSCKCGPVAKQASCKIRAVSLIHVLMNGKFSVYFF